MLNLSDIDFFDFYYNGHNLSEFGGYVGSADGGLKTYSLLPSRTYITDKALGYDGNIVFDSYLEPRVFIVPIVFDSIDEVGIRAISGWLNSPIDSKFYFVDDSVCINCVLDSSETDFESISGKDGECELQFIANDPYYYAIKPSSYTCTDVEKGKLIPMMNAGNVEAYPKMVITNTDSFSINVHDINKNIIQTFVVDTTKTPVTIDTKYCTCISGDSNLFDIISGDYPVFPVGVFYLSFSANVTSAQVDYTPRFI